MARPKPIATRVSCAAALLFYFFAATDHPSRLGLATLVLVCALLPSVGVCLDWIRLERPSVDDAFFAAATILGALVVGLAPSPASALWHPVLLLVASSFALRRRVVAGSIAAVGPNTLTLALERGQVTVDRDAHEALGHRSPLVLEEGAPLALTTRLREERRGEGPFRSARVLTHGPIASVAAAPGELRRQRNVHALIAVGLVLGSAAIGWGAALLHVPVVCSHP